MRVDELTCGRFSQAAPGYRVLVVDGGAVRFECPAEWILAPPARYACLIDRLPPNDRCALTVAWRKIPAGRPLFCLAGLLETLVSRESGLVFRRPQPVRFARPPLEGTWIESSIRDPRSGRRSISRFCLARSGRTQALIVFDFCPEDAPALDPAWDRLLASLALGEYIADFATGRRREQWG